MYVTLLPVILAAGLLAALATGALPPGQGAAGLLLLLCPGADRFLPILREALGRGPAQTPISPDLVEQLTRDLRDRAAALIGPDSILQPWEELSEASREGHRAVVRQALAQALAQGLKPPAARVVTPGGVGLLLLVLGTIGACSYVSRHSAELYAAQHAAALRCRANGSACAAAHVCADAALKGTRALAAFSQAREAEAAARAKGGPPVDLVALAEKEREALGLKELALKACEDPAAAAAPPAPPPPAPSAPPAACADNLCGGAAESICSCHGAGESQRCWSTVQRCQQDAACCSARGDCKGTTAGEDTCSRQVRALEVPDAG